jgi:hypothetical protein
VPVVCLPLATHVSHARTQSAFPASAEEQAFEAERIKRIAAGDEAGVLAEGGSVDELSLLASALERGRRAAEQARCATAEAALLRAELAHEKPRAAAAADEQAAMIEAQRVRVSAERAYEGGRRRSVAPLLRPCVGDAACAPPTHTRQRARAHTTGTPAIGAARHVDRMQFERARASDARR